MTQEKNKILIESIKRLLRRNAIGHLRKIVNKTHAADLSDIFPYLTVRQQHRIFELIDDVEKKGFLFSELDEATFLSFVDQMNVDDIVPVLEAMPSDDVADILGHLQEEKSDAILKKMKREGQEEVESLLKYGDDTAGGIMVPDFIALREDETAGEAIKLFQKDYKDVEMPFYLYVVDEYGKLVGVSSLRQLVVVSPETPLKAFMSTDVISVRTDMDQEEVAKVVARYDILAVPVVDDTNTLVGIITVDDIIDIIKEEADEDMLKMAGIGAEMIESKSVFRNTRTRMPWLLASCFGGLAATFIIASFSDTLQKVAALAAFIPVINGMGGNIGTQSSTIVVRGISMGYLDVRKIWAVVFKELSVGFLLGVVYGILIGTFAHFRFNAFKLALAVGSAVVCSMSVAALVGSLVPMVFARMKIDPAVATGPFVTTAIDIIAVFFYFQISSILLGL